MLREPGADLVQARTGLPEALAAWRLARRHRRPFVFQYSFPTPLSRRAAFEESRLRAPVRLLCWFEDALTAWLLRRADLALLISEAMAERWRERGVTRAVSFPLGADTSVEPSSVEPVDLPPETVIYFGSMDAKRRLGFLLEVFARVLETRPEAHLVMLGDPVGEAWPSRPAASASRSGSLFPAGCPGARSPATCVRPACRWPRYRRSRSTSRPR